MTAGQCWTEQSASTVLLGGMQQASSAANYNYQNPDGEGTDSNSSVGSTPQPESAPVVQFAAPDSTMVAQPQVGQMEGSPAVGQMAGSPGVGQMAGGAASSAQSAIGQASTGSMTPGATAPVPVTVNLQVLGTTAGWMSSTLQASQEVTLNVIYQATITPSLAGGLGAANAMSAGQEALQLVIDRAKANNFGLQAWNVVAPAMNLATWIGAGNLGPALVNMLSLDDSSGAVAASFYRQGMVSTSSDPLVQWVDSALYNNGQPLTAGSAPLYGTYWDGQGHSAQQALSLSAPFISAGVGIVAGMWIVGPTALLGLAGPAVGAITTAGQDAAVTAMSGGNAGAIASSFGQGFYVGALIGGAQIVGAGMFNPRTLQSNASWQGALGRGEQRLADLRQGAFASGGTAMSESAVGLLAAEQGCLAAACFSGRMLIDVAGGKKRADAIRVGDLVASRSEFDPDGPVEYKEVQEVFARVGALVNLHVADYIIETTAEHPFYVRGTGWVPAGALEMGDFLSARDGQLLLVQGVAPNGAVEMLYNWRVAHHHTYFVGSTDRGPSVWRTTTASGSLLKVRIFFKLIPMACG